MGKQYSQRTLHRRPCQGETVKFHPGDLVKYADSAAVSEDPKWTGIVLEVTEVSATVLWGHEGFIWVHDDQDLELVKKEKG